MYRVDRERLSEIAHQYGLDLIVIFGSQARGRDVPGSDTDVAVRFVQREWGNVDLELDLFGDLVEAIESDGDLDVAFLNGAAPLLLYQVACTGVPLYERTPGDFALFQSYAARRYYDSQKFFVAQDRYLRERYGS
jgi:predicted nucleotidyltransferase